jgi:CYTH domain-containing protein
MHTLHEHKYAKVEWERRFLLGRFPEDACVTRVRHIADRYLDGTNLRLRRQSNGEAIEYKLTQKLRAAGNGARQGLITTIYLTESEFRVLQNLPAKVLNKTRYSVPPFGIDVFADELRGLVLAEAEFYSEEEACSLTLPSYIVREVTDDLRFTGGELVRASRDELEKLLEEFRIRL